MTLEEYFEALYDACFEEYCVENNIVTLLDGIEYFEERTSERKQRVQQQRKDAKKMAKIPMDQRPNPNVGATTHDDKIKEGKKRFLDRVRYDPNTRTIEIMGNKFDFNLKDTEDRCVFYFDSGKRQLELSKEFYLLKPKQQDGILLHELAHKRLGHGISSSDKSDWDLDLSKTNDREIANILKKNGIKVSSIHGDGVHEVEADASSANTVGEKALFKGLRASVLHSNSNRQIRRDHLAHNNFDASTMNDYEKELLQELIDGTEAAAKKIMDEKIKSEKDTEKKKALQQAANNANSQMYTQSYVDAFCQKRNEIIGRFSQQWERDRLWNIFVSSKYAKKLDQQQKKAFRKFSQSEIDLRQKVQHLPEIQELRTKDERYHTPDRTKGESKGKHEDFIDRYISAKPAMREYQGLAKRGAEEYGKYKDFGTIHDILGRYRIIGINLDKALIGVDLSSSASINDGSAKFAEKYSSSMSKREFDIYWGLFQELYYRALQRERTQRTIKKARSAKAGVDKDIRKAYDIKDSAKKFNADLQKESIMIFDEDFFNDMTDDQLEQCMIEMYENAIKYSSISNMIDRMYDLEYK